jgi:hypothetical protein
MIGGGPMIWNLENANGGLSSESSCFIRGAEALDDNVLKRD